MVAATDPNRIEQVENLQQRYEAAGLTGMIAESAAEVSVRQQNGEPIDEVDRDILGFADQTLAQQQELETLPRYQQSLDANGFDQASAAYEDAIPAIQNLTTSEAVESRQVLLAANLTESGVEANTSPEIKAQAKTKLQNSIIDDLAAVNPTIGESAVKAPDATLSAGGVNPALEAELQMLNDAQSLMNNAREAGIAYQDGNTTMLQGDNYRITQQGDTTVVEGNGRKLIADGNEILKAEGFGTEDYERFNRLGQRTPDELSNAVSQAQESGPQRLRDQRERQREVQKGQNVEL